MWNPNITFNSSFNTAYVPGYHHKRKIVQDPTEYDIPPPKMLITEEKMVSQLRGIHLSQDYTTHGNPGPSNAEVEMDEPLNILGHKSTSSLPTLVMCDEIRELQKCVESPLPKHLLDNFKRPTNALVLWRPPAGDLGKYLMSIRDAGGKEVNKDGQPSGSDVDMEEDDNNNESANQNMNGFFTRTV